MTQARRESACAAKETPLEACASERFGSTEFWFRTENGEATVVFCESEAKRLVVPETLGGAVVAAVADNAFSDLTGIESAAMPAGLRSIGAQAFARCLNLRSVEAGQSLSFIGQGAFRGCRNLIDLAFPETLSHIGSSALSNTAVKRVAIPAACTSLDDDALCTGPSFPGSIGLPYASSLIEITVHPDNPVYCMEGSVLCRTLPSGSLEAVLCAARVDDVALTPRIERVLASAFAGTCAIGHLRVGESTIFPDAGAPLPNGSCERFSVAFDAPRAGATSITLEMPKGKLQKQVLDRAFLHGRACPEALAGAYDEALTEIEDELERTRLMAARLAEPTLLDAQAGEEFRRVLDGVLVSLCTHAGARNDWSTLDNLMQAGVLDAERAPETIDVLNRFGFTLAAAHVMSEKEKRFGKSPIDYGI